MSALLLAIAAAGWHWWPELQRWQSLVRLRHDVLNATVSPTGAAIAIRSTDNPDHWLGNAVANPPDDRLWRRAYAALAPTLPRDRSGVLLFVHERTTRGGKRLLVKVDYLPMVTAYKAFISIDVRLFEPGTLLHPKLHNVTIDRVEGMPVAGTVPGWPGAICGLARVDWGHSFDLSVGRPDPNDDSQFLFDYTLDHRAGRIIGKVADGMVSFRAMDGSPLPLLNVQLPTTRPH